MENTRNSVRLRLVFKKLSYYNCTYIGLVGVKNISKLGYPYWGSKRLSPESEQKRYVFTNFLTISRGKKKMARFKFFKAEGYEFDFVPRRQRFSQSLRNKLPEAADFL